MPLLTRLKVFERMRAKGFDIFENDSREYNLNIIGIRSKTAKVDEFGCQLYVGYKHHGKWNDHSYRITTYPGRTYLQRLLNPAGCAILCEGQYKGIYAIRKHRGKYDALCQTHGPVRIFRDKDKDDQFDLNPNTIEDGEYGINIHNSPDGKATIRVGAYSAGCQVFSDDNDFFNFMALCYRARDIYGNKFTYTLINE